MPGDISRRTFTREKRYAGVFAQQGRVLSDADLNEQVDIGQYRTHTEAVDVIGDCGVPKLTGGFALSLLSGGVDLAISAGRLYTNGLLCELDSTPVLLQFPSSAPNRAALATIIVDGRRLELDEWVEIAAPGVAPSTFRIAGIDTMFGVEVTFSDSIAQYKVAGATMRRVTTYATQPDFPEPEHVGPSSSPPVPSALKLANGVWLAYLVAWQREINVHDDLNLRETALNGVDTTTRLKNVWQVRLIKVTPPAGPLSCGAALPEWTDLIAPTTARLNARTKTPDAATNPCILPPQAGFRRLENQLYRIEVQRPGGIGQATFKWSRENASVETRIQVNGNTIVADDLGKDDVLGFAGGQWVEIVDEEAALVAPHALIQIDPPDEDTHEITTAGNVAVFSGRPYLKLRRWDQTGSVATKDGVVIQSGWMDLEDGVQVQFSGGNFRAGDYWLVPARTAKGDVEWPPFERPNTNPIPQSPTGIARHFCRLGLLTVGGGTITSLIDCRETFPPLTAITASDVDYNPSKCQSLGGATTVQEALDILCHVTVGICTVTGVPGMSVQAVFDRVPDGADAEVCFPVGNYTIDRQVVVMNKGHLKVSGAGAGTRMLAPGAEAALVFSGCKSVSVRDLYAESGKAATGGSLEHQFGTLTFGRCGGVDVTDVALKSTGGPRRGAACLTVIGNAVAQSLTVPSARVTRCTLDVGHFQCGILLVDVARSHVEDNTIRVFQKDGRAEDLFDELLGDRRFRLALRSRLVSNAVMGTTQPPGGVTNARIDFGRLSVLFKTHPMLKQEWGKLLTAVPPPNNATPVQLLGHLKGLAQRVLVDAALRAHSPKHVEWFDAARRDAVAVGGQGIVVAGRLARDVRVLDNTIEGMMQGIHIGVSHGTENGVRAGTDHADTVRISGNTVGVRISQDAIGNARHGIFVGNCKSLTMEDNFTAYSQVKGADNITASGLIVWGDLGSKAIVRHNHLRAFTTGVEFIPRFPFPRANAVLWIIADNMFEGIPTAITFPPPPNHNPPVVASGNKQS